IDGFAVESAMTVGENGVAEEGEAAHSVGCRRIYTAARESGDMETAKITVSVSDLSGSVMEREQSL
ncbi:MAG: hypothetical protein LBD35_07675, partial [Prevotellaceae bacterium]|nr:hypothetical protein [Prevotellaceae bacterium]